MAGQRLVVGLVRGLHGLAGTVRVEVLTDDATRFEPGAVLRLEGSDRALTVAAAQPGDPGLLVRFREIRSRTAAEALRERYLEADAATRPAEPDAVWWHEVIGVPVTTTAGEHLGTVFDVFRAGGGEVYVVRGGSRGEILVPAVRGVVTEFAPREGRLVVDAQVLALEPLVPRRPRGRRSSRAGAPFHDADRTDAASEAAPSPAASARSPSPPAPPEPATAGTGRGHRGNA